MELDLELTTSPRKPAIKRSKDMISTSDETNNKNTLNDLGWVIQTLTIDIEKRKTAKTSYKLIEDCLPKLNGIVKTLGKATKVQNMNENMFKELSTEFANDLAKIFSDKEAEIP